ncbi:MAG: hypothetical protein ABR924_14530 [Terracidiphilus sp.]|jgi:hypothetical protein
MNTQYDPFIQGTAIVSLSKFCRQASISDVTAWRWRRRGWLSTVNICGRPYITDKGLSEFLRRAEAGDFAKEHKVPRRKN